MLTVISTGASTNELGVPFCLIDSIESYFCMSTRQYEAALQVSCPIDTKHHVHTVVRYSEYSGLRTSFFSYASQVTGGVATFDLVFVSHNSYCKASTTHSNVIPMNVNGVNVNYVHVNVFCMEYMYCNL